MAIRRPLLVLTALAAVLTGCATAEPTSATVTVGHPAATFSVQIARTADEQRTGLTGRDDLPSGTGMLFQFDGVARREMWMAGMRIRLDAAWIADGQVVAVVTLSPCTMADQDQCPRWKSPQPADALLEVPAGGLVDIKAGAPVQVRDDA